MRFRPSQLPLSAPWRSTASNVYCEHDGVKRHCVNIRCESVIWRSEEHTSELQSQSNLVCRLLLEQKNAMRRSGTRLRGYNAAQCRTWTARGRLGPGPRSIQEREPYAICRLLSGSRPPPLGPPITP